MTITVDTCKNIKRGSRSNIFETNIFKNGSSKICGRQLEKIWKKKKEKIWKNNLKSTTLKKFA